jgi:hypothetical protein
MPRKIRVPEGTGGQLHVHDGRANADIKLAVPKSGVVESDELAAIIERDREEHRGGWDGYELLD